jgi:hypothetical protein
MGKMRVSELRREAQIVQQFKYLKLFAAEERYHVATVESFWLHAFQRYLHITGY